jgi:Ino eighty subunit 2
MDTINKLLKKQTPKMRKGRANGDATPAGGPDADSTMAGIAEAPAQPPTMVRWISNKNGSFLGVPEGWLESPAGMVFKQQTETERMRAARARGHKMIEVIEDPMEIDVA